VDSARKLVLALFAILLTGCGNQTIDGSSDEAFKESIAKVRNALPADRRDQYDIALGAIAWYGADLFTATAVGKDVMAARLRSRLNGMTGENIFSNAASLQTQDEARSKEGIPSVRIAKIRIKVLEEKKSRDLEADKVLAKISIKSVVLTQELHEFLGNLTILKITARNGTSMLVSAVCMTAKISSEGRTMPWLVAEIGHKIPGGIEPGEEKTWEQSYDRGDWHSLDLKPDMHADLIITSMSGPNDSVFPKHSFSAGDEEELQRLHAKLGDEKGTQIPEKQDH
jgi:hypothetical protein